MRGEGEGEERDGITSSNSGNGAQSNSDNVWPGLFKGRNKCEEMEGPTCNITLVCTCNKKTAWPVLHIAHIFKLGAPNSCRHIAEFAVSVAQVQFNLFRNVY